MFLFNLPLFYKCNVKYRKLRSSCNILLAVDGCFVLLMQTERVVRLVVAVVWETVTMRTCFFALLVPAFGMDCCMMIQTVIAFDRFLHVFLPIWFVKFFQKYSFSTNEFIVKDFFIYN
jgi:hypothetical protein